MRDKKVNSVEPAPYIVEGRKQPVQKRAKITVQSILQAAEAAFAEEGYALVSTNRIAEKAGVAISSLYQYFPDKKSIYLSLYSQTLTLVADELNRTIIEVIDTDLHTGFTRLVDSVLNLFEEHQLVLLHLADEMPEIRTGQHYLSLSNLIFDGGRVFLHRKLKQVSNADKERVFFFLHTVTFASMRSYMLTGRDIFERQVFIDELVDLIVSFLRTRIVDDGDEQEVE